MLETISELNKATSTDCFSLCFPSYPLWYELPGTAALSFKSSPAPPSPAKEDKKSKVTIGLFRIKKTKQNKQTNKQKNYYKERQTTLSAHLYTLDLNRT